jgi:hypothetical protein
MMDAADSEPTQPKDDESRPRSAGGPAWVSWREGTLTRAMELEALRAWVGRHDPLQPTLQRLNLAEEQINGQSLEELEDSLNKIDELITESELSPAGDPHGVKSLTTLLELKSLVLNRISILRSQAHLNDLKDVVAKTVQDASERQSLLQSIGDRSEKAIAQAQILQTQAGETFLERRRAMLLEVEFKERTSAMRRSWFERESVASIVGALLLLSLGTAVIIAMFTHTPASQIVTSSFLLILGYFFGQAGNRNRRSVKPKTRKSNTG